jgi:hypothetical protein
MQAADRADSSRIEARAFAFLYALACIACVFPLFRVQYLPIQDLPQHLAAVRVLHDYHDPALGFARYFELDLLRTQYLTVYLATHVLSYVLDVELAMRVVIALTLVATPLSMKLLLEALGKDGRLSLLAFPLAYNAHLVLGFVNFLAAIPLAFYAITLAIRQRVAFSWPRAVALGVVAIVCFYTHVVPFGLSCAGVLVVAAGRDLRRMARGVVPLLPSIPVAHERRRRGHLEGRARSSRRSRARLHAGQGRARRAAALADRRALAHLGPVALESVGRPDAARALAAHAR